MARKSVILIVIVAGGIVAALFFGNPVSEAWPLKCPLYQITGWQCPICGMQRAIHEMMHGNWAQAWKYNPAFWLSLPYIALLGMHALFPRTRKWTIVRWADSDKTLFIWGVLLIAWGVLRNIISI